MFSIHNSQMTTWNINQLEIPKLFSLECFEQSGRLRLIPLTFFHIGHFSSHCLSGPFPLSFVLCPLSLVLCFFHYFCFSFFPIQPASVSNSEDSITQPEPSTIAERAAPDLSARSSTDGVSIPNESWRLCLEKSVAVDRTVSNPRKGPLKYLSHPNELKFCDEHNGRHLK
jgi:hypothetical protein